MSELETIQEEEQKQPETPKKARKAKKEKPKKSLGHEIVSWILTIVVAVVAALVIRSFVFELVRVDGGMDDRALCAKELEAGVRVWPISPCFMGPVPEEYRSAVLLGYGDLNADQMRRGVELLAKAWAL